MSTLKGSSNQCDVEACKTKNDKCVRMPAKAAAFRQRACSRDTASEKGPFRSQTKSYSQSAPVTDPFLKKQPHADNGAHVEVSVKAHKQHKVKAKPTSAQSWGDILKTQSSNENVSRFTRFDPLRTVHFLAKELQSKVRKLGADDSSIDDVIYEMKNALKRVPPEMGKIYGQKDIGRGSKVAATQPEKVSLQTTNCQTPNVWYLEPEKLQQHLEESSEKIEKACQQMESLCAKLKKEKDELERLLKSERSTNSDLIRQLDDYKLKLSNSESNAEILKSRNEQLNDDLQKLQFEVKSRNTPSAKELMELIEVLQKYKTETEEENLHLKQQLQFAQMETEKYEAILQTRDVQVKEIKDEMTQLQEVVNQQLKEFQTGSSSSPYASEERVFNNAGKSVGGKVVEKQEGLYEIYANNKLEQSGMNSGDTSFLSSDDQVIITAAAEDKCVAAASKLNVRKRHIFKIDSNPTAELGDLDEYREKFNRIKNKALSSCCCDGPGGGGQAVLHAAENLEKAEIY